MIRFFGHRSPIASPAQFCELYERNKLPVYRYIYGLTGGPREFAEDLAADTFLRAWKARHRFEGDLDSATGWLIQIAKRLVIDEYRHKQPDLQGSNLKVSFEENPEQITIHDEVNGDLLSLLSELPVDQCETVILRHLLGWRISEIAVQLGVTDNNVSVMIHRALAKLRVRWDEVDSGGGLVDLKEKEKDV